MIAGALLFVGLALANAVPTEVPSENVGVEDATEDSVPTLSTHSTTLSLTEGTWMSTTIHKNTLVFDLLGDIWSMSLRGGEATQLTAGRAWDCQPALSPDGEQIAYVSDEDGNEQIWIMNVDGSERRQITDEDEARVTDPVWDPAGPWILARRRTVDTRSIGVTELWQYHLDGGRGFALTSLDAHPHAGEITTDGENIWFSSRTGRFEYNQDPTRGLWKIMRLNRETGQMHPVVRGSGGAARPSLSPDGSLLAFVSRFRDKTQLELLEVATGRRRVLLDTLSHDQMEGFALHGVYPAMSWSSNGRNIVLWEQGKLWSVDLDGDKKEIPFEATGTWEFVDVPRWQQSIPEDITVRVIRRPQWSSDDRLAFSALGALWIREPDGKINRASNGSGFSPAWRPDGRALAWTSWQDPEAEPGAFSEGGGTLHVTTFGWRGKTETIPMHAQVLNPSWSDDGRNLVLLRGGGGGTSTDPASEAWFDVVLMARVRGEWVTRVVTTIPNRGSNHRAPQLFLHDNRVWFLQDRATKGRNPSETVLVSVEFDGTDRQVHLVAGGSEEIVPSPDFSRVAYRLDHQVHVAPMPHWSEEVNVTALPSVQLTEVVGDWLGWTPDGAAITWMQGATFHSRQLDTLASDEDGRPTDDNETTSTSIELTLPREKPTGVRALTHARVVTMEEDTILNDATIVIEGDRIARVEEGGAVPAGAEEIDCTGKTIIPGLIDVHAHGHYSAGDILPEQSWRYLTSLDFGVTTIHDPSAPTDTVFTEAERVEVGFQQGPRVYSTGFVLYGALSNQGASTPTAASARHHLQRLKAAGAISAKIYQQSRREQRQWYVQACHDEKMLCVAEGGGDLWMNLGMVADGFHAVEHSLPVSPLYADVQQFLAASQTESTLGTAYSPTLLVAYGGLSGENWFYQHRDPLDDPRLMRHHPERSLLQRTWRRPSLIRDSDWHFQDVARDAASMARNDVLVTLGAHGQLQGLGVHWELWALAGSDAMTPHEALQAATIAGAQYLGLDHQLGSIAPGKLADLVILNQDPLVDIEASTDISLVIKNGVPYP